MTTGDGTQNPPPFRDASIERDLGLPVKICTGCRAPNLPASQYCYRCGVKLPDTVALPGPQRAGFWRRFGAYVIDNIFITIGTTIIFTVVFSIVFAIFPEIADRYLISGSAWDTILAASELQMTWFELAVYGLGFLIDLAYWTGTIGWKGRSVGKIMLGLKVVRVDGSRIGYPRAFLRYWGYMLCWFTFGLGFLAIAWSKEKRGLHDLLCDSIVVRV